MPVLFIRVALQGLVSEFLSINISFKTFSILSPLVSRVLKIGFFITLKVLEGLLIPVANFAVVAPRSIPLAS